MKSILEIQNISKTFKINPNSASYKSLRESIIYSFKKKDKANEFWALKDVSFEIKEGESLAIIGKNGAGKSTLLKILSRISPPTKGKIISRGRIASLLEVGTGFHPELTGRENVFLNGSILGMRQSEIKRSFDEIVSFAGVDFFIDTPLKHYSSGMQLRLAFAVAAFLTPEILIIDEVLAVGDAEFQRKCMGRINNITDSGRTVILVSHNITQVQQLCTKGVLLDKGKLTCIGKISDVVSTYLMNKKSESKIDLSKLSKVTFHNNAAEFRTLEITGANGGALVENSELNFKFSIFVKEPLQELAIGFAIKDSLNNNLIECRSTGSLSNWNPSGPNEYTICAKFNPKLKSGVYELGIGMKSIKGDIEYIPSVCPIEITESAGNEEVWKRPNNGLFLVDSIWTN